MGRRLRELRLERELQQADVASRLGVSPAYLSLIESGKRPVQLPLLVAALALYQVEMEGFLASLGHGGLDESLARLLDEPLFRTLNLSRDDLQKLGREPRVATTITALFNLYKNTRSQLDHLMADVARREREGQVVLTFDYTPFDEVTDFLERQRNHFGSLEDRAESLRRMHGLGERVREVELAEVLRSLGVDVEFVEPSALGEEGGSVIRRFSAAGEARRTLVLSRDLAEHRRMFQLAHAVGLRLLDTEHLHEPIVQAAMPRHTETARILKIHLANYFAGALLLPYDAVLRAAQRTRYDVEYIAEIFDTSYETVAHRLCNLSDPQRPGVPFHFLRVDVAGNISKRYAATGLRFPHGTGSCPKWVVHTAFLSPHAVHKQYSVFPDGAKYFCFAKVVSQPRAGSLARGTVYAIGLGTHADRAVELAYADDMPFHDPERMAVPVGTTCRFCERVDCNQRAAPSYKFAFRVDEYVKKDNFFSPLLEDDHLEPTPSTVSAQRLIKKKKS